MNTQATDTDASLQKAYGLLRQGRFPEAEALCRQVLATVPGNSQAMHLLGLVLKDSGDLEGGERLIRQSIERDPQRAEFRANLANLLRRQGRLPEAERSYRDALAIDPRHRPAKLGLARALNDLGQHAAAEEQCRTLISRDARDAEAWSILGASLREQQRLADAEAAYRRAIALQPNYAAAHHNLGALLSELDQAEQALAMLDRAGTLGVQSPELTVNRGNALFKLYRFEEAERAFEEALRHDPLDASVQLKLAELRYMRGDPKFARSIVEVAATRRDDLKMHMLFGDVLRRAGDLPASEVVLREILKTHGPLPEVRASLASVLHELGQLKEAEAEALEAAAARPQNATIIETLVAIQLAAGRHAESLPFIRAQRAKVPYEQRWIAYEATAARMSGNPLYQELYDYSQFVKSYDIEAPAGWSSFAEFNSVLLSTLEARHRFAMHPLAQSLRNGSQTARDLRTDEDATIRATLEAFREPIEAYRSAIGSNPAHPLTARNFGTTRLSGCWSVQLRREGFHVNHIHPEGWISSAYYVSVPDEVNDADLMSGWLKFGETRFPVPGAAPAHFIQPRAGRLVLFPSYMWHGTNPIHGSATRTTIAFDAVSEPPP
jgi:tetratricopeptide (TPR) repeat protein